jgi:hypothetical protein
VYLAAARVVHAFAWTGHVIVQAAGAADAIVTAMLGVPRIAVVSRRVRAALAEMWEA